jgi:hypothetical protein
VVVAIVGLVWRDGGTTFVRWWARTAGVIAVALIAPLVVIDVVGGQRPPLTSVAGVAFVGLWAVLFVGVAVAFRWEGTAGLALVLASLALQAQVIWGGLNPYILAFAAVGLGFVFCWWRTRHSRRPLDQRSGSPGTASGEAEVLRDGQADARGEDAVPPRSR